MVLFGIILGSVACTEVEGTARVTVGGNSGKSAAGTFGSVVVGAGSAEETRTVGGGLFGGGGMAGLLSRAAAEGLRSRTSGTWNTSPSAAVWPGATSYFTTAFTVTGSKPNMLMVKL